MTFILGATLIYLAVFGFMLVVVRGFSDHSWGWSVNVAAAITTGMGLFFLMITIGIEMIRSSV